MNEQIKKDRELLEEWEKFEGDKYHYTTFFSENMEESFVVEELLAAQKRVTQYEERQRVAKLVTRFIIDRMGDIHFTDLQELERLILADNN